MKRTFLYLVSFLSIITPAFSQVVTVLSVDGGGIRGLIPAIVLEHLESRLNRPLSECFDVMVGTSTGGVIVLGLSVPDENKKPRYKAKDLVEIYKNFGKTVFAQPLWQKMRTFNGWVGPKYSHENLEKFLRSYLGEVRLKDALTELVIPTFDVSIANTEFFTTNQARTKEGRNFYMRDIACATCAAPTYFAPHRLQELSSEVKKERTLIDGGITVNNPVISSYIYATNHYSAYHTEFFFVSVGTGDVRPSNEEDAIPYDKIMDAGRIGWSKYILKLVMDGAKNLSDGQMQFMFPKQTKKNEHDLRTHYIRLQVPIKPEHSSLDDTSPKNIAQLERYAHQIIEKSKDKIDIIVRMLNRRLQKGTFVPNKLQADIKRTGL